MTNSIVACTNCGSKNRLGRSPEGQVPVCGKCGSALPWMAKGSDADFHDQLRVPVPVLVDFWAPWCGPCRLVAPILEDLAREYAGKIKVVKLNVDENPSVSGQYQVRSIPTMILFDGGVPAETIVGAIPKHALVEKIAPHLATGAKG